ncbi:MAG: hypothetical protein FWE58_04990 [Methanobrevibacter sp.]|nr:hypothetical protein [Methanobrevibacter sp.]
MHLLNERLRRFFSPIAMVALMSCVLFFFSEKDLNVIVSYYTVSLLVFYSTIIIFFIYVIYPLVKILFKKYGVVTQRIIVILVLISSSLTMFFSFIGVIHTLLWILYLSVFLNFSSNIEKKNMKYYILSYPINKNSFDFDEILNSSSFNVLISVVLLTVVIGESLYYFDLYFILASILSIVLVISSVFYGKSDGLVDY